MMASVSESRRSKRKLEFPNNEKNKKKASGTLWSEEDDISLLKGMTDYELLNDSSPYDDMGKFLDFVKPCIHFDVQRKQLTDRLWRLKNRFLNSGYDLSKPHYAKLFDLSKSIKSWGGLEKDDDHVVVTGAHRDRDGKKSTVVVSDVGASSKFVKNKDEKTQKKSVENPQLAVDSEDFNYIASKYPNLTNMLDLETLSAMPQQLRKNAIIDTIKHMGRGKANKFEEQWADLRLKELELHAMKLDLTNEQINLILKLARADKFKP